MWFELAANQGNVSAQGMLYGMGLVVGKSYVMGYKWINLAASSGEKFAIKMRDRLNQSLLPQKIAEGQRLSSEFEQSHHL